MSCILFYASGQSDIPDLHDNFYKSKILFEQDVNSFKYYKKSKRQKIAAISLGVVSIASIVGGAYVAVDFEPSGQSAEIGIIVVVFGLSAIGGLTGIPAIAYTITAKKNKRKSIDFYYEKYGSGIILEKNDYYNYCIRANLGNNGMGLVISF